MALDKSILIGGYLEEMKEHLDAIKNDAIILNKNNSDEATLSGLLRELHTIKGTSRMMGFHVVEDLSHALEDVLKAVRDKQSEFSSTTVRLITMTTDRIEKCLNHITIDNTDNEKIDDVLTLLEKDSNGQLESIPVKASESVVAAVKKESKPKTAKSDAKLTDVKKPDTTEKVETVATTRDSFDSISNIKSIRINLDKINGLISTFDNLIIRQFRIKRELKELEQIEETSEKDMRKTLQQVRSVRKQLTDDLNQLETSVFDVQSKIFDLQMMPLDFVLEPLHRSIELEAVDSGKNVEFDISKCDIALDKVILEQLSDVLIHLVRNALDHGIETPEQRKSSGKSKTGHIAVTTQSASNRLEITVSDDGAGIDYEAVRKKAIARFPDQAKDIEAMKESDLSEFLFMSGFSTRSKVSNLSGRGVGLDIVRANMEKIKGKIHLESEKGKGTSFTLSVPLSLATLQGLFVTANGTKLLIPSHYVQEVLKVEESDFIHLQNQVYVHNRNDVIPVFKLSSIVSRSDENQNTHSDETDKKAVVVVEYLGRSMGIIIDDLLRYVSLVVKPLPKVFKNTAVFQGIVFDEYYSIVPILHIPEIMRRLKSLRLYDRQKNEAGSQVKHYTVLVVDDSYTTKQIEKTILEAENYIVETAGDGIEALDVLKTKKIDAVITDIKMPRMDGLVLVSNIRRMEEYKRLPVFVVSSIYDEEVRRQFGELNIQGYIVKSDFERGNLISIVREVLK